MHQLMAIESLLSLIACRMTGFEALLEFVQFHLLFHSDANDVQLFFVVTLSVLATSKGHTWCLL
jgi:hypothetical protein